MTMLGRRPAAGPEPHAKFAESFPWVPTAGFAVTVATFVLIVSTDFPIMFGSIAGRMNAAPGIVGLLAGGLSLTLTLVAFMAPRQLARGLADRSRVHLALAAVLGLLWAGAIVCVWLFRVRTHGGGALGSAGTTELSTLVTIALALTGLIQAAESYLTYDPDVSAYRTVCRRLWWARRGERRLAGRRARLETRIAGRAEEWQAAAVRHELLVQAFRAKARLRLIAAGGSADGAEFLRRRES
jgi:hypothetical protein